MSQLNITIGANKTLTASGIACVGEQVNVQIVGAALANQNIRFRIVDEGGDDLVRFPMNSADQWTTDTDVGTTKYSATVDFDTDKLRKVFETVSFREKLKLGIIVDSFDAKTQFARGVHDICQWSVASTEDPTVVTDWKIVLEELNGKLAAVDGKVEDAETAKQEAESARNEAAAIKLATEASVASIDAKATAAEAARAAAVVAKNSAETAKQGAETARSEAQSAKTAAETAKSGAETAKNSAEAAANRLGNFENTLNSLSSTVAGKADANTVAALQTAMSGKADKAAVDAALSKKADAVGVDGLTDWIGEHEEMLSQLGTVQNQMVGDVAALQEDKADAADVYTQIAVDDLLATKADAADVAALVSDVGNKRDKTDYSTHENVYSFTCIPTRCRKDPGLLQLLLDRQDYYRYEIVDLGEILVGTEMIHLWMYRLVDGPTEIGDYRLKVYENEPNPGLIGVILRPDNNGFQVRFERKDGSDSVIVVFDCIPAVKQGERLVSDVFARTLCETKANKDAVYTKSEVDEKINSAVGTLNDVLEVIA